MNLAIIVAVAVGLGPSVAVEVATDDVVADAALRGWLGARLIEEGYDLAPSEASAASVVRVSTAGTGLAVVASGSGIRSYAVEAGPSAVQRLEVLHRAMQGVEATASTPARAPGPGVVVHFSGATNDELFAAVANAAAAQGTTVRAQAQPGDALLCVAVRGDLAEFALGPAQDGCAPSDFVATVSNDGQRRRTAVDVMQRLEQLTQPVASQGLVPEPSGQDPQLRRIVGDGERSAGAAAYLPPAEYGAGVSVSAPGDLPAMHGEPRAELRIAAEGGIMARGAIDAGMRARARVGRINGLGGRFEVGVVPSTGTQIRVVDTFLMVGPDWHVGIGERVHLLLSATMGADIHTFTTDVNTAADVDWALALPIGASIALRGGTRLHAMVHPGLSGVDTSHARRNLPGWERTAWRVGVSVGFSHGWRIE